jgi:DNA-directed RNA polymerase specialized sigma24 family protein
MIEPHEGRRERRIAVLAQGQKPDGDCYFEEIILNFRSDMYRVVFSILRDQDNAEDAVSDALLKAFVNLHGFTPEERECLRVRVRAWLSEITRNISIDLLKKHNAPDFATRVCKFQPPACYNQ